MAWLHKFRKQTAIPQHEAYNYPKQKIRSLIIIFNIILIWIGRGNYHKPLMTPSKPPPNSPHLIYENSNMTSRFSGHFSIFGLVFFVLKSLLGIARLWSREQFEILTLKSHSRVRILIYQMWTIEDVFIDFFLPSFFSVLDHSYLYKEEWKESKWTCQFFIYLFLPHSNEKCSYSCYRLFIHRR